MICSFKLGLKYLETFKRILGEKFLYVPPNEIDNIETVLKKEVNRSPKSSFTINMTVAHRTNTIKFNDISLNTPTSWKWDFGDGSVSDLKNPDHRYTRRGTFKVTLQVTNEVGTDSSDKVIRIL
jgi:PKD repeat protein